MKSNNKGERERKTKLKFKKRLKQLNLKKGEGNFYCYKTMGKPCSCEMCSPEKYSRKRKYKDEFFENED